MKNFDEYIIQGEPSQKEKAQIWQTAIGLQDVDGLKVSDYLIETAKENIENKITISEVKYRIDNYYKQSENLETIENRTDEADKVSANIAEILSEKTFSFSPAELLSIHRRLFTGVETTWVKTGKYRDYNITKSEWVLDGKTVFYASADNISATLDYDFKEEKNFKYKGLSKRETVEHIVKFISGIWQIHAFGEGNTRTIAVFTIKYLRTFGFEVKNDMFAEHSWYFRNALVRANFNDLKNNIHATTEYLMRFFGNLLFNEHNELKNRYLHIKSEDRSRNLGKNVPVNDTVNVPVNDTVNDTVKSQNDTVFSLIQKDNKITAVKLAEQLNVGIATVKRKLKRLKESGQIERIGSDKTGEWKIITH
jgi:fido (protein-threonine AMPylation protein)